MHKLTNDRMKWGVSALLTGTALTLAILVRTHIWLRLPGTVVSFDGKPTARAAVYRSCDGEFLVWVRDLYGGVPYIIVPSAHWVGVATGASLLDDNPDDDGHWLVTERFALSGERHLRGDSLYCPFASDIDPHVVFKAGSVEFTEELTSTRSRRVRVKF